jgi:hypothetical protein
MARQWLETGTDGTLRHAGVTPARGRRGGNAAQGEGSSPATSRWRRCGRGTWPTSAALGYARGSAVTYAGRQRRGEAAGNLSTRWWKRGEHGNRFSRRMTGQHTYLGRRRGRRRRGALGHAQSEVEPQWLRTWAVRVVREARRAAGLSGRRASDTETRRRGSDTGDGGTVRRCQDGAFKARARWQCHPGQPIRERRMVA